MSTRWHGSYFLELRTHREEKIDAPVVLVKWYDWTKWVLERVDAFPKNQRFIFGQRLADHSIRVLEILVDASNGSRCRKHKNCLAPIDWADCLKSSWQLY